MSAGKRHFWSFPDEIPPGAWREKRRLAAALREVVALCVVTDAPADALASAADRAEELRDTLARHPGRTFGEAFATLASRSELDLFADRGTLVGWSNPFAPPMELFDDGALSVATVTFGPAFEGAPGCVHGGLIAAAFDQLFGHVQVSQHVGSLTAELSIRYRRPTPIQTKLRIEGTLERVEGRRSWVRARMLAGGEVTAEANGVFVSIGPGHMQAIVDRGRPGQDEREEPGDAPRGPVPET